jgi:hypothetical protein
MAAAKRYSGRLAYDPETDFHTDEEGVPVVTDDGGKTWRYADDSDPSHHERYHERYAGVDGTANRLLELQLEHGRVKAEELMREQEPHHFAPTEDDPHFQEGATDPVTGEVTHTRVKSDPDHIAATVTGHTDAYAKGGE